MGLERAPQRFLNLGVKFDSPVRLAVANTIGIAAHRFTRHGQALSPFLIASHVKIIADCSETSFIRPQNPSETGRFHKTQKTNFL
jgi:hypothetical protein